MSFIKLLGGAFKNLAREAGRKITNPRSLLCPHPCVIAKRYLAAHGLDGWGWFLFVALLIH